MRSSWPALVAAAAVGAVLAAGGEMPDVRPCAAPDVGPASEETLAPLEMAVAPRAEAGAVLDRCIARRPANSQLDVRFESLLDDASGAGDEADRFRARVLKVAEVVIWRSGDHDLVELAQSQVTAVKPQPLARTFDVGDLVVPRGPYVPEFLLRSIRESVVPEAWSTPDASIDLAPGSRTALAATAAEPVATAVDGFLKDVRDRELAARGPANEGVVVATVVLIDDSILDTSQVRVTTEPLVRSVGAGVRLKVSARGNQHLALDLTTEARVE
jgi:hypothetical protein